MGTSSGNMPFYNSIRFKLTLFYSFIFFLFSGFLVASFNLYVSDVIQKDPEPTVVQFVPFLSPKIYLFDDFSKLKGDERQRIQEIRENDLRRFQKMSVYALFPIAAISFVIGYYISGKFLDPLVKLNQDIQKLESKDLGVKIEQTTQDEIGTLVASFNDLSLRLKEAFNSQERFVQDASHELRTPLTIIQTNLDTVVDDPQTTKEQMSQAIQQALGGVKQLKKLVNYLLELTSIRQNAFRPVDISAVVTAQVDSVNTVAKEKGLSFTITKKQKKVPKVLGDESLLGRVVMNVLENAVKYSTPMKDNTYEPIFVAIAHSENIVTVSVTNHGVPIPKDKLPHLFERFYQLDPSRSKKLGGYGLGLAIAKKVVEEHNGKISAQSTKEGINTFTITLPVAKAS